MALKTIPTREEWTYCRRRMRQGPAELEMKKAESTECVERCLAPEQLN